MTVITDADRDLRCWQLGIVPGRIFAAPPDPSKRLVELVEESDLFTIVYAGRGKHTQTYKFLSPRCQMLMQRRDWLDIARAFLARCREDRALRQKAEAAGIDIESFEEGLSYVN